MIDPAGTAPASGATPAMAAAARRRPRSLTRRMIGVAALWIGVLLFVGGFALDRVLTRTLTASFDAQIEEVLKGLIAAAEIGPVGEVRLTRLPADQRFLEPNKGAYFQVSAPPPGGCRQPDQVEGCLASRSLWDRRLELFPHADVAVHRYDSQEFAGEPLRVMERDAILPGSDVRWRFQVAFSRAMLDAQLTELRHTLEWSFVVLGLGLLMLAALQALYGLWPLKRVRREVAAIRSGERTRIGDHFPREVAPLVDEINDLLEHNEAQAEEARRHAGNLAHALKTPLTVITNAATAQSADLADTVCREATTMRRQVDHHLARARAIGRRAAAQARCAVWPSAEAVERAVSRMYEGTTIDIDGDRVAEVRVERQDLDEMLGNLVENAAKYGGGRVFVTVRSARDAMVEILVEDDGPGIPADLRGKLFARGQRLDTTGKPGTGLGLAIVRDVAEIYGGKVSLEESEDLGGLLVTLALPAA